MCLRIFLAASDEPPLIPFDTHNPMFNVTSLEPYEESVRQQFSMPVVVNLGSSTSCGCGFDPEGSDAESSADDRKRDRAAMASYVDALAKVGTVELFICWDGDYAVAPIRRLTLSSSDLAGQTGWISELTFVSIPYAS